VVLGSESHLSERDEYGTHPSPRDGIVPPPQGGTFQYRRIMMPESHLLRQPLHPIYDDMTAGSCIGDFHRTFRAKIENPE
jgi:hypothetical protein